jgi:hypothetical protein
MYIEITEGATTVKKIMRFASQLEQLILKLQAYGDDTSVKELQKYSDTVKHMLHAIGCSTDGGDKESV